MISQWRLAFVAAVLACVAFQPILGAGDKKEEGPKPPEKKKAEPFKDIVIDGELSNADLKDKVFQQSYCKTYTIKLEKGKAYQIELNSRAFQTALRLEDSTGQSIAQNIDQFGMQRASLFHQPSKTGDFEIAVTSINGNSVGKFTLTIKDASRSTVLAVSDKLNQNDKAYAAGGGKKHKLFTVDLEEGKTYQIDMVSKSFDSYLYFESPDGKLLAQDDDGGGYPDARIIHKAAKSGKYRVITSYFGGGGNLGDFTLTVRLTDGSPPLPIRKDK
jgi:hypothetical protein